MGVSFDLSQLTLFDLGRWKTHPNQTSYYLEFYKNGKAMYDRFILMWKHTIKKYDTTKENLYFYHWNGDSCNISGTENELVNLWDKLQQPILTAEQEEEKKFWNDERNKLTNC